jgi:hypothetical protein
MEWKGYIRLNPVRVYVMRLGKTKGAENIKMDWKREHGLF